MNRNSVMAVLVGLALIAVAACTPARPPQDRTVTVFAAASLTDALTEIAADYERDEGARCACPSAPAGRWRARFRRAPRPISSSWRIPNGWIGWERRDG